MGNIDETARAKGDIGFVSAAQVTSDIRGYDRESKLLLRQKPVLANLLKAVIDEFTRLSVNDIMELLDGADISGDTEVSPSHTNAMVRGENTEFAELGEVMSVFDTLIKIKNPVLSEGSIVVNLHVDIESQKDYSPGYPIEKRGIYYLAREISSQIPVADKRTDYGRLEKCYSIWICRDNIPKKKRYSITRYSFGIKDSTVRPDMRNKAAYDLMELAVIRLGSPEYIGEDGILDLLNALLYKHKEDFRDRVEKYIDLSEYDEFIKEARSMDGLGYEIYCEGLNKGREDGRIEGRTEGRAEGRAEGLIEGIFYLLADMGEVAEELRNKIKSEKDLDMIRRWHKLAAKSESISAFERAM